MSFNHQPNYRTGRNESKSWRLRGGGGVVLDELKECLRWSLESDYMANISPG